MSAAFLPASSPIEAIMPRKRARIAAESAQVDGGKKGLGGYESKMRMDDMPIDWVEQVLSFLSLTDVYKCKSVCMAWHVAADRVLSDWDTLVLRDNRGWPVVAGKNQIWLQGDAETWIKRLEHLVRLKRIFVTGDRIGSKLLPVVHDVVVRNAASLTLLHMRSELMPFGPRGTVFHNLRYLECSVVYLDQVAYPRLQNLHILFPGDYDRAKDVDALIETLVHNCPLVRSITMMYARMTDAGLRSLSRLRELQHLIIGRTRCEITTEGILSLLRGGSRNVLRDLKLELSVSPDFVRIRAEVKLMRQETGRMLQVDSAPRDETMFYSYTIRICLMAVCWTSQWHLNNRWFFRHERRQSKS